MTTKKSEYPGSSYLFYFLSVEPLFDGYSLCIISRAGTAGLAFDFVHPYMLADAMP